MKQMQKWKHNHQQQKQKEENPEILKALQTFLCFSLIKSLSYSTTKR